MAESQRLHITKTGGTHEVHEARLYKNLLVVFVIIFVPS